MYYILIQFSQDIQLPFRRMGLINLNKIMPAEVHNSIFFSIIYREVKCQLIVN